MQQEILYFNTAKEIAHYLSKGQKYSSIFLLTDSNCEKFCLPMIQPHLPIGIQTLVIPSGDENKNIETLQQVWAFLSQNGATRHSLLINLGGGMLTDLGGFAAASFKRGIDFVNLPTTLLGSVDAAVGGKTGINFNGLKNEIGVFAPAQQVYLCPEFFRSLPLHEVLSGYSEMLKHALLSNRKKWAEVIGFDPLNSKLEELGQLVKRSVEVKEEVVRIDPTEKGIRKALNLGHTIAHSIESWAFARGKSVAHGYAVAWGLVCELYLSHVLCHFPVDLLRQLTSFVRTYYGEIPFGCQEYEELYQYMLHDKKNSTNDKVNFTLLSDIGEVHIDQTSSWELIFESFDFLRENR